MLLELHVKNLALIEAADVELEDGLNILTGETGAGKSIMIGSVNLALGQKASREMIRNRRGVRLRGAGFLSGPGKGRSAAGAGCGAG